MPSTARPVRLLPALLALAALTACATLPGSPADTRPGRGGVHEVWEAALEHTASSLRRGDLDSARGAVLEGVGEAVYFPARDPRVGRTEQALDATLAAYGRRGDAEAATSLVEAVGQAAQASVSDHPLRLYPVVRAAQLLTELGRPEEVDALLSEAAERFGASLGPGHPFSVRVRVMWAGSAAGRGELEEAETHARRALVDGERALGPDSAEIGEALAVLGRILLARGRAAEAVPLLQRALRIAEASTGPASLPTAQTRIALADAALQGDDLAEARRQYEAALPAIEEQLGAHNPLRAVVLYRLGRIHFLRGELRAARRRTQESLAVSEPLAYPDDPAVAGTLLSLAEIELASGREAEAVELTDGLAELLERLDPDDPRIALALASPLGSIEARMGRFERAQPLVLRGLAAAEATSGPDSMASASRRNDLAYLYVRMGQTQAAALEIERSLPVIEVAAGPKTTPYALGLDTLGLVRVRQGRAAEGRAALETATAILRPAFGPDSPVLLEVLEHYAEALEVLGDPAAPAVVARIAEARRRRDERLAERTPGRGHTRVAFRSDAYGYAVELPGDLWSPWPDVTTDMPSAEFGALHGDAGGFAVVPVDYFGTEPEARFALPALLSLIETEAPAEPLIGSIGGRESLDVITTRSHGGLDYRYRARALSGPDAGYVVVAWVARGRVADEAAVLSAVERITFPGSERPALDPEALSPSERHRHGAALNEIGLRYAQGGRHGRAVALLERAAEIARDDPVVLENLVRIQIASGRYGEALAALDTSVDRFADYPELRAYRALAASRTGDQARALADYERAFALGLDDEGFFASYVDALWESGRPDEALAALDARIETTRSRQLRVQRAGLLRRRGDAAGALQALEALDAAGEAAVLTELVLTYAELGRHREAIVTCDRMLEQLGPSADVYASRARSEYALGWYREAALSLDRALALEPGASDLQELATHVSALAGQGENALLREPIEPVPLPTHLLASASPTAPGGHSAAYDFWTEAIEFESGSALRRTTWFRARLRDARGVDHLASLEIPFNPLYERIYVNAVTVRDASGTIVGEGSPADYYVLDPPDGGQATSFKTLHVPIPGLRPGTTLEVQITRREQQPPRHFPYLDHRFSRTLPVGRSTLVIRGDVERLATHVSAGVERSEDADAIAWWIDTPSPARWEPLLPPGRPDLPSAHVGDRVHSWASLSRGYLAELEPFLAEDPEAAALADTLTADLSPDDRADLVRVLTGATRERLTYTAIEFGRRARIPQPVGETLDRRYGDCKDHALLLLQLLRHAGLSADLALVNRSKTVDPQVPALDQFDHMIVHCPACGGAGFLDPTDKDFASKAGVPRHLGGAKTLILDPEDPRLVTIPLDDPEHHFLDVRRTVHIDAEGGVRVAETVRLGGSVAAPIRGALRAVEPSDWEDVFRQRIAGDLPRSKLHSLAIEHVDTPEQPLELSLEYEVGALFADTGRSLVGRLPAIWERQMLTVPPAEGRRAPFALGNPLQISSHTEVIAPRGHALRGGPSRRDELRAEYVQWSGRVERESDGLALRLELTRPPGRFPARDYPRFRDESARALGFLDAAIEVERKP